MWSRRPWKRDPAERYQTARELVVDLRRLTRVTTSAKPGSLPRHRQTLEDDDSCHRRRAGVACGRRLFLCSRPNRRSPTRTRLSSRDFDNTDRRSSIRRHAASGTVRGTAAIAFPQPDFGPAGTANAGADGQPKETRLTSEVAQQICERTASVVVLEGSIASLGSQYVLGLRAKNCNTGSILDQEQIQAAKREDVLNSLSEIVRKLRTRLGESLATVEKHSTPLADATTSSLEALKAYSTGRKLDLTSGTAAAIPLLRRRGRH